ncbi:alpha-(1,3)-fucosyltransferase C-like [Anopheles aquasalis]|uniref:alpha-(1,3)-fucosyltransferase C-like n=1 Tax=Anopheles aquasalis TaxID=42839 RepID=UPI00215AEBF6|nr:alpha-(1,3)-fucosyltransferase C-like [Anopheles aquasalis]
MARRYLITRNSWKFLLAWLLFCVIFYLLLEGKSYEPTSTTPLSSYPLQIVEDHNDTSATLLEEHPKERNRTRFILLYTNFFDEAHWGLPSATLGPDYFKNKQCAVTNCVVTSDHGLLKSITEYDALVYHTATYWNVKPPSIRVARQIYIAAIMESPAQTWNPLGEDTNYFFNWTMTYRLDSDVLFNYGFILDRESGGVVGPAIKPMWRNGFDEYKNASLVELVSKKRSMAAQFVSHCNAVSKRDELVQSLQSAGLTVDVYGACGSLKCPHNNPECEKMMDDVYWFYLSFENALYVDYVTEKLYNALVHNIVPIVYGGADYTRFLPPGSYIDVQDYASPKELVDYLLHLTKNPHEYVKYFWWKEHYVAVNREARISFAAWCQLCEKLHSASTSTATKYYRDLKSWWHDDVSTAAQKLKF